MSKGDAAHAAQHQHGVRYAGEPAAPQTVEQRLTALERRVEKLEENQKPAEEIPITAEE
jgi:hypothetical protein